MSQLFFTHADFAALQQMNNASNDDSTLDICSSAPVVRICHANINKCCRMKLGIVCIPLILIASLKPDSKEDVRADTP